ncbi:MAG: ATP synthase F1 subunit epsilon [Patescibacteria group bacterium]|nr:ATP synthase F1 subunit epsilon [Patescibacteria group bacterium]
MAKLKLQIVSQEKELLSTEVEAVSAQAVQGMITILPGHIPLFTRIKEGELLYLKADVWKSMTVSNGFLTVSPSDEVTIMVDSVDQAQRWQSVDSNDSLQM